MEDIISDVNILGNDVKLLSKKEMAAELGVCYRTIERWYKGGYLRRIRIGGRIFFSYTEVYRIRDRFIEEPESDCFMQTGMRTLRDVKYEQAQGFHFRR